MKKTFFKIMVATFVLLSSTTNAQIKNSKTETIKIYGNCGMCKTTIEKVGSSKKVAKVDWNQDTQMATITYDFKKTNTDEILKRVALAGYDSDKFLAPDEVYNNLHGCCKYERVAKIMEKTALKTEESNEMNAKQDTNEKIAVKVPIENPLQPVFDNYFIVKDALISSDANKTAVASKELLTAINMVKMDQLEMDVHLVWMKVFNQIKTDTERILGAKDIKQQRNYFTTLSNNVYALLKVSKSKTVVYYQFCPMANEGKGANWLSKETTIKNPYYGSMMLSCGKTVETIK